MIRLVVPAEPVAKGRPRFVRATGRAYTPEKTRVGEWQIRQAFLEWQEKIREDSNPDDPDETFLYGPLRLTVTCYVKMPKGIPQYKRESALPDRRPDLDQYVKSALDALNGHAFQDDSQVVDLIAYKRYGQPARWEITLEALSPQA